MQTATEVQRRAGHPHLPTSVAFTEDGTLGIGMSDLAAGGKANQLLVEATGGGQRIASLTTAGAAWELTTLTNRFLAGMARPEFVDTRGDVTPVVTPTPLAGSQQAPTPLMVLGDGRLAGTAADGIVEFGPSSLDTPTRVLVPARQKCQIGLGGSNGGTLGPGPIRRSPTTRSEFCSAGHISVASADANQNIWIVPPTEVETVAMLKPSNTGGTP